MGLLWPVKGGKVTSGFGMRGRRPHEGIDIAAPEGTEILAAAAGTVIYAGSGVRGYGNLILLRHPGALVTVYAHNRRNRVVEKETVRAGQVIAEMGRTGNASASHLHFEVRRGEVPEDPLLHFERSR
jgi:murein DD-endopeptidase MepM/ murein hydrolase activator NlpD